MPIIFNINIFKEIIQSKTTDTIQLNDGISAEVMIEESYQRLLNLQNPFFIHQTFFPFEINISFYDPTTTFALLFIPLRFLFNTHQSMMIILLLYFLLSEVGMYLLLRRLKVSHSISFIFSLVYTFTPFISVRIPEHYSYTPIYFFPWLFFFMFDFLSTKSSKKKYIISVLFSLLLGMELLTNFYYFITSLLLFFSYISFYLVKNLKKTVHILFLELKYIIFMIILFFLFIFPWLWSVQNFFFFGKNDSIPGFGGAVELSADLLSFVTPSESNPFYRFFIIWISSFLPILEKYKKFYMSFGQHFAYAGFIILATYFYILINWKRLDRTIKKIVLPHLVMSLFFAILLLGPFLKIFKRWFITLDEGIQVVMPMPFLILHYIPFLNGMRDPTRLLPAFVFLGCIVSSVVINKQIMKYKYKKIFITCLFLIFFIDQFYITMPRFLQVIPLKIYRKISLDNEKSTVLEIPFTVRDGFRYTGFVHSKMSIYGTLLHQKPIIGGYLPRINDFVFNYYHNLPFINHIAHIIDKGNYNPYTEKPKDPVIVPFSYPIEDVVKELDFLNIQYIILKNEETYTKTINHIIQTAGYTRALQDKGYDLYSKKIKPTYLNTINFGSTYDYLSVVSGLSKPVDGQYRSVNDEIVRLFIKPEHANKFELTGESAKSSIMKVYMNKKMIGTIALTQGKQTYVLPINQTIEDGINEITLKVQKNNINNLKLYSLKVI